MVGCNEMHNKRRTTDDVLERNFVSSTDTKKSHRMSAEHSSQTFEQHRNGLVDEIKKRPLHPSDTRQQGTATLKDHEVEYGISSRCN